MDAIYQLSLCIYIRLFWIRGNCSKFEITIIIEGFPFLFSMHCHHCYFGSTFNLDGFIQLSFFQVFIPNYRYLPAIFVFLYHSHTIFGVFGVCIYCCIAFFCPKGLSLFPYLVFTQKHFGRSINFNYIPPHTNDCWLVEILNSYRGFPFPTCFPVGGLSGVKRTLKPIC